MQESFQRSIPPALKELPPSSKGCFYAYRYPATAANYEGSDTKFGGEEMRHMKFLRI